jgi:magnesium-transporting ATPase (P-type)
VNNAVRNLLLEPHESNYIRTTKYTFYSFLPLSLMYQFKREANIYFLLQAILNSIPQVSAMNPITAYLPLSFVLGVSMFREGLEDYQRYKSDVNTNKKSVKFIKGGRLDVGQAKDVKVGDLLLVNENEDFPADMVIVASSTPDASCYIQTSSLDGEKNLKTKRAPKFFDQLIPSGGEFNPSDILITAQAEAEPPNGSLYSFAGNLRVGKKKTFALNHE